jgi:hypothetical protein
MAKFLDTYEVLKLNQEDIDNLNRSMTRNSAEKSGTGVVLCACNPSYLGGGDWEDHDSRPAGAKS